MKNCINCGTEASNDADNCHECGREFAYRSDNLSSGSSKSTIKEDVKRPDGKTLIGLGWAAFITGIVIFLISLSIETTQYGNINPDSINLRLKMLVGGGALLQIGFTLILVGIVVRAIWFLPGKEE